MSERLVVTNVLSGLTVDDVIHKMLFESMAAGLLWGILFYVVALVIALWCYRQYSPLYEGTSLVIMVSWFGHYLGTYFYSFARTDSLMQFFLNATNHFRGSGTNFVCNLAWYVRDYMTGNSYVGTLYFFSSFAFLGSVLWYLMFLQLAQSLRISNQKYAYPAIVLMCWPSYLFFTAGIGKDSLCFFLIPLILLSLNKLIAQKNKTGSVIFILLFSLSLMAMIRPYLIIVFSAAYFLSSYNGIKRMSGLRLVFMIASLPIVIYLIHLVLLTQKASMHLADMSEIASTAVHQQEALNVGSSFPMLSSNPAIVFLLLPYSFLMNLTMPLFIFAHNKEALIASIENSYLVYLLYQFLMRNKIYKVIKQNDGVRLCFMFFMVGMALLSLINTNLGLSTRQKTMYVPAFLVVAMLVWLYKKQNREPRKP